MHRNVNISNILAFPTVPILLLSLVLVFSLMCLMITEKSNTPLLAYDDIIYHNFRNTMLDRSQEGKEIKKRQRKIKLRVKASAPVLSKKEYAAYKQVNDPKAYLKLLQAQDPILWRRSDLVITTKLFGMNPGTGPNDIGLTRKHIIEGLNASLKRLQLEYVDIVYAHRPDALTSVEQIVRSFTHLIRVGKAFHWGTSMWKKSQIIEAFSIQFTNIFRIYNTKNPKREKIKESKSMHYVFCFCLVFSQ
jgi:hypothetical protein